MSKPSSLFAQVAILERMPRAHDFFDYAVPSDFQNLTAGDLVTIPFRASEKIGVVLKVSSQRSIYQLKNITRIIEHNFLTRQQLQLADYISKYYGVSVSSAIEAIVQFPILKKGLQIKNVDNNKSLASNRIKPWLISYGRRHQVEEVILSLINQRLKRRQSVLLLVPQFNLIKRWQKIITARTIVWQSGLKVNDKRKIWSESRSQQPAVYLGTRSALFLPYGNLGGIIVDYAEDENYKQFDQNPRYDANLLARKLAEFHNCSLALVSPAPRLDDVIMAGKIFTPRDLGGPKLSRLTIIDQDNIKQADILSPQAQEKIGLIIAKQGKVLILHQSLGLYKTVLCRDCQSYLKHDQCQKTLTYHDTSKKLYCHNCQMDQLMPKVCLSCQGVNLVMLGGGIELLAKECRDLYKKNRVQIIKSESANKNTDHITTGDIVLTTSYTLMADKLPDFSLIIFTTIDQTLTSPEFRAQEHTFQVVRRVLSETDSEIMIQTRLVDSVVYKYLDDCKNFYQEILKDRLLYNWPPTKNLIKLSARHKNQEQVKKQINALYKSLTAKFTQKNISILPPYPDARVLEHGYYIYHLLVKFEVGFDPVELWHELPADIIIDRDPRFILS